MERSGTTKVPRYAQESTGYKAIIQYTNEFKRIESLPRRQWDSRALDLITAEFRTPNGTQTLWPVQAAALTDTALYRGSFLPIGVGRGKALVSLLAPLIVEAVRPVLFVPADLRNQTFEQVLPLVRKHWRLHPRLHIIGYSELSLAKNAEMLEKLKPDLIVLDECHRVKNPSAGRTKRLLRHFRDYPETMCVAMSGTICDKSLKDFAHIIYWCLKEQTPLPLNWNELTLWDNALAVDNETVDPGALRRFGEPIRQGFRKRLTETPGVVATAEEELGTSLRIQPFKIDRIHPKIIEALNKLRDTWETPNGDIITTAPDLWRHIREVSLGFWYRWIPEAPKDWLDARREWKRYVRETLKHNRRKLDTELQVWNECALVPNPMFLAWKEIKDSFKPNTVAEWLTYEVVYDCNKWLQKGGIIWTEHVAFGKQFGDLYHGAGDSRILTTQYNGIVASVASHTEGKNLERYSRNLVVSPMASGKAWEQLLGRTHRVGQKADTVTCDVFLHIEELEQSFEQAQLEARYLEDMYGNRQKLNYADILT